MNPEAQFEYWCNQYKAAKKALEVAQKNIDRISRLLGNVSMEDMIERGADNMLAGPIEPVVASDWPQYDDQGCYYDRTCPDVAGRDVHG